jgi:hypothetical protein
MISPMLRRCGLIAAPCLPLLIVAAAVPRLLAGGDWRPRSGIAVINLATRSRRNPRPIYVLTQRNDDGRTGNNLSETELTTATVEARRFGKLFSRAVDGDIYAQPLYVAGLRVDGQDRPRNVVFTATQHNSVYAFDADDAAAGTPLWHVNLGPSVPSHEIGMLDNGPYRDISPEIGITGSPVIDLETRTLWVAAKTRKSDGGIRQVLAAVDIASGRQKPGSPVEIRATVRGKGVGSTGGALAFNPRTSNQRASLLLHRGVLYVAWASHADIQPYHGWVMAYDARTLKQLAAWSTTPDGEGGGVWMSGTGPSADAEGNVYLVVGDGTFSAQRGGRDYGDSFVKLRLTPEGLRVRDWFTPHDEADMNMRDKDLGSTGALLSPDGRHVFGGSKLGWLYQLDASYLGGHRKDGDTQIPAAFRVVQGSMYGTPLYWDDPRRGLTLYTWCSFDRLRAFRTDETGCLIATPAAVSSLPPFRVKPGGFLSLSADGGAPGTAIVWASHPDTRKARREQSAGVLRAFDAEEISRELWNSEQVPERDRVGAFAKFCMPTIANGKVYLGTVSDQLHVYGLLPAQR